LPLKKGNKSYKNFKSLEKSIQREGKSKESAQKIAGKIYQNQEGKNKKRKR
jgi:hypothetical protein